MNVSREFILEGNQFLKVAKYDAAVNAIRPLSPEEESLYVNRRGVIAQIEDINKRSDNHNHKVVAPKHDP